MSLAEDLKFIFADIATEKELDLATNKPLFPLESVQEVVESLHPLPNESSFIEKVLKFPGASKIHVTMDEDADIPTSENTCVSIINPESRVPPQTINSTKPRFNGFIEGSQVKVTAKIEAFSKETKLVYQGYKLRIKPKVSFFYSIS